MELGAYSPEKSHIKKAVPNACQTGLDSNLPCSTSRPRVSGEAIVDSGIRHWCSACVSARCCWRFPGASSSRCPQGVFPSRLHRSRPRPRLLRRLWRYSYRSCSTGDAENPDGPTRWRTRCDSSHPLNLPVVICKMMKSVKNESYILANV